MITGDQVRAGRSLLRWNQTQLAETTGLALSTIKRLEGQTGPMQGTSQNVWKIQTVLEEAGIIFIDENGGGVGVRLRDRRER